MSGSPAACGSGNGRSSSSIVRTTEVARHHLQSFETCRQRGETGQSFSHLSLVLYLQPHLKQQYYSTYMQVFEEWIATVESNNGYQEAMTIFEVALKHYPESPDLHWLLAKSLYRHGSVFEAWSYVCRAQSECQKDPNAKETRNCLTNALVDRWHLPMLNDTARNCSFKRAIERAINEGHNSVLDIGSGTGLLSIYAKRAGARNVYACEADKFMCEMSSDILQSNQAETDIKLLNYHSKDLVIPMHIPERVSLVVSETVDAGLFGEHILTTLQHAWSYLLQPPIDSAAVVQTNECVLMSTASSSENSTADLTDLSSRIPTSAAKSVYRKESPVKDVKKCKKIQEHSREGKSKGDSLGPVFGKVIPAKAKVYVALISCDYIARQTRIWNDLELDYLKGKKVRLQYDEPYMCEKLSEVPGGFHLLSDWNVLTTVDFNSPSDIDRHLNGKVNKTLELKCISSGTPDALVTAFDLHVDEENWISTRPDPSSTLWENAVYPVSNVGPVSAQDVVKIGFYCNGVINLVVDDTHCSVSEINQETESIYLNTNALIFLNSKSFVEAYVSAAQHIAQGIETRSKSRKAHRLIVCDTTPFPVAGLSLLSSFPNAQLFVEEKEIQKILEYIGFTAQLCEDLEEEVDALFMLPVAKDGTLKEGIVKKILMFRLMMAEDGVVFPQELDVVIDLISCPTLSTMTEVNDSNTCGVKVAEIFNIVKTSHHLDIALDAVPVSGVTRNPIPMIRLSLLSGITRSLVLSDEISPDNNEGLLVLGGDIVEAHQTVMVTSSGTINALPYWFNMRAGYPFANSGESTNGKKTSKSLPSSSTQLSDLTNSEKSSPYMKTVLSTRHADSPCNQSVFMLDNALPVEEGNTVTLKTVWRDGVFGATVEKCA